MAPGRERRLFGKRRREREPDDVDIARDYIEDASIRVLFRDGPVLVATCSGRTRMYVLGHDTVRAWWCSCLRDDVCPHLLALQWILGDVRTDVPAYAADEVRRARELVAKVEQAPHAPGPEPVAEPGEESVAGPARSPSARPPTTPADKRPTEPPTKPRTKPPLKRPPKPPPAPPAAPEVGWLDRAIPTMGVGRRRPRQRPEPQA